MDRRRADDVTRTFRHSATRRRVAHGAIGTALAAIALGRSGGETPAHRGDTVPTDDGLEQAIGRMRAATADFINAETAAWKAMCSHLADATLFGGWGGHERGWEPIGPRDDWAAARFAGGEVAVEGISRVVTADLRHTVHIDKNRARSVGGGDEPVPVTLRVSHLHRREDGERKPTDRRADPLGPIQVPVTVLEPGASGAGASGAAAAAPAIAPSPASATPTASIAR